MSATHARILFRLLAGGDLSDSSVVISDVVIATRSVPEPGSLSLGILGLLSVGGYARMKRVTHRSRAG